MLEPPRALAAYIRHTQRSLNSDKAGPETGEGGAGGAVYKDLEAEKTREMA